MTPARVAAAALVALAALGCGVVRENQLGEKECPDFERDLAPLVAAQCAECHTGDAPSGGYQVGDYATTASRRADGKAWVDPGNPDSPFLLAARGDRAGHPAAEAAALAALTDWAVRCRAAPTAFGWHPRGWLTPTDDERFHGRYLRNGGLDGGAPYPFAECAQCHGEDLKGGKTAKSCDTCHENGPTACNTCHGGKANAAPPRALNGAWATTIVGVGAHQTHVAGGALGKQLDCDVCHRKPNDVLDDGHWRNGDARDVSSAEVVLAKSGPGGTASWSRGQATCANGYCHAPSATDSAARVQTPKWTLVGQGQADCGTCHGAPPSSHADDRCEVCHGAGYSKTSAASASHLDFKLDLRGDGSDCAACHAGPASASFVDLRGSSQATDQSVGAHQKHTGASRFRGPIACAECHRVPAALVAPGHIDSAGPAEVFASDAGLAFTDGAQPTYAPATATCGSVYCHGAGVRWARDTAPGREPSLAWTRTTPIDCGSCHGVPPQDGTVAHTGRALTECVLCHGLSVDGAGAIRFTVDPNTGARTTTHLDGMLTGSQ